MFSADRSAAKTRHDSSVSAEDSDMMTSAASTCEECGLETPIIVDGVPIDACFKDALGSVINACCGHGDPGRAYVRIARVHSNGTDGCVDICGGEVVGYGEWKNRQK